MTDERLKALEAACRAVAAGGKVEFYATDVLDLVRELRELRRHATNLSAHQSTIESLQLILLNLREYAGRSFDEDDGESGSGQIPVQDPGR